MTKRRHGSKPPPRRSHLLTDTARRERVVREKRERARRKHRGPMSLAEAIARAEAEREAT